MVILEHAVDMSAAVPVSVGVSTRYIIRGSGEPLGRAKTLDGSVELEPHLRPEGTGRLLSVRN